MEFPVGIVLVDDDRLISVVVAVFVDERLVALPQRPPQRRLVEREIDDRIERRGVDETVGPQPIPAPGMIGHACVQSHFFNAFGARNLLEPGEGRLFGGVVIDRWGRERTTGNRHGQTLAAPFHREMDHAYGLPAAPHEEARVADDSP